MKIFDKIIICFVLLLACISCDNRKDIFKREVGINRLTLKLNNQQSVEVNSDKTIDSAKLGKNYRLSFVFEQNYKVQVLITLLDPSENVVWKREASYSGNVDFLATQLGEYRLIFSTSDVYGQTHMQYVAIDCFDNLPPIAVLNTHVVGRELQLDASQSYDLDAVYGGGIVEYNFTVTGDDGVTRAYYQKEPTRNLTLSDGNYSVYLKVRDNQEAQEVWSEQVSQNVIIKN